MEVVDRVMPFVVIAGFVILILWLGPIASRRFQQRLLNQQEAAQESYAVRADSHIALTDKQLAVLERQTVALERIAAALEGRHKPTQ